MAIPGTVPVTGPVAPTAETDTYASHIDKYGKGSLAIVVDEAEMLVIPKLRRSIGMERKFLDIGTGEFKKYELINDPVGDTTVIGDWEEVYNGLWEEGTGINSAKLISQNNQAIGENAVVIGEDNIAGSILYTIIHYVAPYTYQEYAQFDRYNSNISNLVVGDNIEILDSLGNQHSVTVESLTLNIFTITVGIDVGTPSGTTFTDILFNPILSTNDFVTGENNKSLGGISAIIGGKDNTNNGKGSVILGGDAQTLNDDSTVMVPALVITDVQETESVKDLGVDANGKIVDGSHLQFAASDEDSDLEVGTTFSMRMVEEYTFTKIYAGVTVNPSGADLVIDIKKTLAGSSTATSIFDTKLTIDDGEYVSNTSVIPYVLNGGSVSFAVGDLMTVEIIQTGTSGIQPGSGLKMTLKA